MAISFRDVGGDGIDEHISTGIFDWDELDLIQFFCPWDDSSHWTVVAHDEKISKSLLCFEVFQSDCDSSCLAMG